VDQATSSHQDVLRLERECGEVANLDWRECLSVGGDPEKGAGTFAEPPPNFTDFQRYSIRETGYRVCSTCLCLCFCRVPLVSV
jgi:hypothetical protein